MERQSFLPEKYKDLPGSKPVERAVAKKVRAGEKGPTSKEERVDAYLDRLDEFFKDPKKLKHLKYRILEKYITKYEEVPPSYWKAQEEEARKRGESGDWERATDEQKEEVRRKHAETVLTDQRASLEQWVDYFALPDSNYIPKEIKYWIFRNILNLKELVKTETDKSDGTKQQHIEFPKRSKGTVSPFPDLNQEALSYIVDALDKKLKGQQMEFEYDIQSAEREEFLRFLAKEDFAKLYAWANELHNPIPEHLLPVTKGEWVKYKAGSDPQRLVGTIRGRGTGWCTAGEHTAKTQLSAGDFYVYYSLDDKNSPTIPRLAIRMEQAKIAEVRGIAYKQNVDPHMPEILEEKLQEFGSEGQAYQKRSADMARLTEIETKTRKNQEMSKDDLVFLYELEGQIEGFGYQRDPRIKEIKKQRNPKEDAPIVLDCRPKEIAWGRDEINGETKAYIGKLDGDIFDLIQEYNIEQIYTSFPEGRVEIEKDFEVGPITLAKYDRLRERYNRGIQDESLKIQMYDYTRDMMDKPEFRTLETREKFTLIRLKVNALFSDERAHTTAEILGREDDRDEQGRPVPFTSGRMTKISLEFCPPETGPYKRLKDLDQPMNDWYRIAMKPITDRSGNSSVFELERGAGGAWLSSAWAHPDIEWHPGAEFVFRLRKPLKS